MPELYQYQRDGVTDLVLHRRRYLADAPGLGKTPQAIRAATRLGLERILVICPAIAREMWRRQWMTWGALDQVALQVLSYDQLVAHPESVAPHDVLILDEAHYCKNPTAKRTKAALTLANRAERVWLLSGTPMPNHVGDWYAPLRAVWPDLLKPLGLRSYNAWLQHFAVTVPTQYGLRVVGQRNVTELREMLDRVLLRRTGVDVVEQLPPLHWENVFLPPGASSAALLQLEEELAPLTWDDAIPTTGPIATARRLLGQMKADVVGQQLREELESGAMVKLVVFAYHREVLSTLERWLEKYGVCRIDGDTPATRRDQIITNFQNGPNQVFLGQLTAAGTAITLTAAAEVVLVEQSWNPDDNLQAVKRIHRIGQEMPCRARMFFAPSSIDDAVARVLARKLTMRGEIFHS